ncbi:MAG: glycosyltransferase family 2 protein [Chthoniobacterales bacterium]
MAGAPPATVVDRTTVGAIIPGYCEEKHVGDVVRRTLAQLDHVLVVDDGSSDTTAERAREAGAEVIVHEKNRGKGEAIQTGLAHWRARGLPHVLILDADGQHLPEEIPRFLVAASGEVDLLVGNRMSDLRDMPLVRRMVNRYMSGSISKVCGQNVPDSQCGFRMLSVAVIPHLLDGAARFDYETEMLIVASRKGFRIGAVPISTVYSDEVSSIHPVRDTIRFFKLMRRYK